MSLQLKRQVIFLCSLGLASVALAASTSPAPPPTKRQTQTRHVQNEVEKPTALQPGTKSAPLFVQIVDPDPVASEPRKQQERNTEKPPDSKAIDYSIAAIGAIATVVIAWFTITLSCSTKRLWKEAEKASVIAKTSADAAHTSAESVKQAERAYVTTYVVKPGVVWGKTEGQFEVHIGVKNNGRTPAVVSDVAIACIVLESGEPLSEQTLPISEVARSAFLVPEDSFPWNRNLRITADDLSAVKSGSKTLWIYGYVDYSDMFKRRHRYGFARIYVFARDGSELNVVRPTERGVWRDYDRECN